jgi:hypothetical protein
MVLWKGDRVFWRLGHDFVIGTAIGWSVYSDGHDGQDGQDGHDGHDGLYGRYGRYGLRNQPVQGGSILSLASIVRKVFHCDRRYWREGDDITEVPD